MGLTAAFLYKDAPELSGEPRLAGKPSNLLASFLAYLLSFVFLSVIVALFENKYLSGASDASTLALDGAVTIGAFVIGLVIFGAKTQSGRHGLRDIGLKAISIPRALAWGIGGYCGILPVLLFASILSTTIFRNIPTPEHPITEMVTEGGVTFVVALVVAVFVAPIVEETFFRGMLYNAFRGVMGVWPSALISGAIFAIVHPTLPGGFLPILVLGTAFAIFRERTGSLVTSMICHAINNVTMLLLVRLFY